MNEGYQNFNQGNFDPASLAQSTATVILFCVISDVSPSIEAYASMMNTAARDVFIHELKGCHRKSDIMVKNITFNEDVKHKSGFLPILDVQDDYFDVAPSGNGTALFQAVLEGLEHTLKYREDLEGQGIEVRVNIFINTDGMDNASNGTAAQKIKDIVTKLRADESLANSFTITMLGVGQASHFRDSCKEMGLDPDKCLVEATQSGHDIRQKLGVVSQSVSSSGAGQVVSF